MEQVKPRQKSERRVRFADSMGMDLVSIFLFDLLNNYVNFYNIHNHKRPSLLPHQQALPRQTNIKKSIITPSRTQPPTFTKTPQAAYQQQHTTSTTTTNNNTTAATNQNYNQNHNYNNHLQLHDNHRHQHQHLPRHQQHHNEQQLQPHQQQPRAPIFKFEFTQPHSLISFRERVKMNKVQLESCNMNTDVPSQVKVNFTVRVLNLSYDKLVTIRYTTDEWHTFREISADYKPGINDGWSDTFTASSTIDCHKKERIIFAIRYSVNDSRDVYWDNNGGQNYVISIANVF